MTRAAPMITVGMPILNNARTLQRAIDSVRAQSFEDWQLIISDDGSADDSGRIADAAASLDARITVIRQPVRRGFLNFRVPLDASKAPFFAWLAGDDYWHPDFLGLTHQALTAAAPAVAAVPQAAWVGPAPRPIPNLGFLKGNATQRIRRYLAHPGGTRMYGLMRTEVLRTAFPKRAFHAFDWYLMIRLLSQGPQLSLPQTLLFREETPWWHYAEDHAAQHPSGLAGAFPALPMSWQLVRDRQLPLGALPALIGLNLRKHEELIALTRPDVFRRRMWLYRRLGLPIAHSPDRQRDITTRPAAALSSVPARPAGRPVGNLTAILTFRNAARTLPAALDHLQSLGARVIAIDHGSTDASRAIAAAGPIDQLLEEPWTGHFDLQRQLRLKQSLVAAATTPWILHADADEFVDPPPGRTLADCLAQADAAGKLAFSCDELLFVPQFEDEEHDTDSFQTTLTSHVRMRERDPKQRLFRRDADLGLWLRTGGHSVTRKPAELAETPLTLRHYPGLSLDDLRGQYLSRVFSPDDRARQWHSNRSAARSFRIVEPDPRLFASADPCRSLPFLTALPLQQPIPLPHAADLYLLSDGTSATAIARITELLPGLRIARIDASDLLAMRRAVPVLHIVSHPAGLHRTGTQRSLERQEAENWTRQIALARQWALDREAVYAELRSEELDQPDLVAQAVTRLWQPPQVRGAQGFLGPALAPLHQAPWSNPVRAITESLAADLGYR